MENLEQLNEFRGYWKIYDKTGHILNAHVMAIADGEIIYDGWNEIVITQNVGYDQYAVDVNWNMNEAARSKLGLHLSYNTNFQQFVFEENVLKIMNGNNLEVHICAIKSRG